jgi:hypothetical protein
MEYLIIVKIVAVPLLLWMVSLIMRRWGDFLGAMIGGLPLVSGPVSLIITLEQGVEFGSGMAYNALPGICACIFFGVVYSWLSTRFRWQLTLLFTLILYFGDDPTYRSELWSFGAFILSGAVSGAVICRMEGDGGLLIATLSAIELVLLLFLIATVTSGVPALSAIVNYAIFVLATALTAFLILHGPKRRGHHR